MDIANASNEELFTARNDERLSRFHDQISAEIIRRANTRADNAAAALPFNPRRDVSADAKYLWKRIFLCFWVAPIVAAVIWLIVVSMK